MSLALVKEEEKQQQKQPTSNSNSSSINVNDMDDDDAATTTTAAAAISSSCSSSSSCPICCNAMSIPDIGYPLVCPTTSCDYNMCLNCIQGMLQSEADGYQQASDGSHQVKFCVCCPVCRCKYNPMAATVTVTVTNNNNNNKKSPKSSQQQQQKQPDNFLDQSIIHHVILLRRVYAVQLLLPVNDSELSATHLSLKYDFLQNTPDLSLQKIKDASLLWIKYLKDVHKWNYHNDDTETMTMIPPPELDWNKLETLVNISSLQNNTMTITTSNSSSSSCSNGDSTKINKDYQSLQSSQSQQTQITQNSQQPWRDVTLFYGVLEDIMTVSEQEFLTQLFTSGQADLVAQAAHIVQGILAMSSTTRPSSTSSSIQKKKTTTGTSTISTVTKKPPASHSPQKLAQLRGRFPLPKRMPLCVALPVYDPKSRTPLLSFEPPPPVPKHGNSSSNDNDSSNTSNSCNHPNELILARVHGPAGRLGLRRGDVVTHVQGGCESVHDRAAWDAHLQQLFQSSSSPTAAANLSSSQNKNNNSNSSTTLVVVNADVETATALRERALQMQRELKQW